MTYTPRTRDRFRFLASAVSGLTTVGVVAATGTMTGLAAEQTARRDAARQQPVGEGNQTPPTATTLSSRHQVIVWKHRPHRTVVSTRVVQEASTSTLELGGSAPALPGPSTDGPPPGNPAPHPGPTPTATPPPQPQPTPPTAAPTSGS
jgi:hypothetical protein